MPTSDDGPKSVSTDKPVDAVIPFSRFRASLARARIRPRAVTLLEDPNAERMVPRLPVQELYYAIKEVGLHDGAELVKLASPEQVRGFLDFDAWEKDRFLPERASPWLELIVDAGPEKLVKTIDGLDGEWVALYIKRNARVYDLHEDEVPEEPEGNFYPTPDTFFLLDVIAEGEDGKRIERLIDWLYRGDLNMAREVLMSARWGLDSDLEEAAYRWRSGRMADLGYIDYYEALSVYRYLDPSTVSVGEGSEEAPEGGGAETGAVAEAEGRQGGLPAEFLGSIGEGSLLGRALATLTDPEELEHLSSSLLLLVNRVMAADLVEPGDLDAARAALDRTAHYLDLGLEFLGRDRIARAGEALRTISLTRIFRVGLSLTLKAKKAVDTLSAHAWLSPVPGAATGPATLLDPPLSDVVAALSKQRPMFPLALDRSAPGPTGTTKSGERPFRTLAEIAIAARALEEVAAIGETVRRGLGVDPRLLAPEALAGTNQKPATVTFAAIVATLAANLLLNRPVAFVALGRTDLPTLHDRHTLDNRFRPSARLAVERAFAERFVEREFEVPAFFAGWMDAWMHHLEQAILLGADHPDAAAILVRLR